MSKKKKWLVAEKIGMRVKYGILEYALDDKLERLFFSII